MEIVMLHKGSDSLRPITTIRAEIAQGALLHLR
jgi:hypothetical protein